MLNPNYKEFFDKNDSDLRNAYRIYFNIDCADDGGLQNVFTPYSFCEKIINKTCESFVLKGKKILTTNLEFAIVMIEKGIDARSICFLTDCDKKAKFGKTIGVEIMDDGFFDFFKNVQEKKQIRTWDACIMNPPYQSQSDKSNTKTQAIWDRFVACSVNIVEQGGIIAAIHPSGWRSGSDIFPDAKIIKEKQVEYLEIHDEADGLKTFKATTRFDWYVLKNLPAEHPTTIMDQNGEKCKVILGDIPCIPNCMIEKIISMIAKKKEKTVELICDSTYHTQREHMSKCKSGRFRYEVVYSTPISGPTIWYSSIKNGHFGIPKVIFNPSRPIAYVIDYEGKYGLSQFCIGITGDRKYLDMVANVFENQKTNGFAEFMESCHFTDKIFNKDIVSRFRKDFWKEFIK